MPARLKLEIVEAQLRHMRQIRQDLERILAALARGKGPTPAASPKAQATAPARKR